MHRSVRGIIYDHLGSISILRPAVFKIFTPSDQLPGLKQRESYHFSLPPEDKRLLMNLIKASRLQSNPWVKVEAGGKLKLKLHGSCVSCLLGIGNCCQAGRGTTRGISIHFAN